MTSDQVPVSKISADVRASINPADVSNLTKLADVKGDKTPADVRVSRTSTIHS